MLSQWKTCAFSYLYYTELLTETQALISKIKKLLVLEIKQPIRNIHNFYPLILVLVMPCAGNHHFGVSVFDLQQGRNLPAKVFSSLILSET